MSDKHISIEILEDGRIRFPRGNSAQNEKMIQILSNIVSEERMKEVISFLKGSDDIKLLLGDNIFCG